MKIDAEDNLDKEELPLRRDNNTDFSQNRTNKTYYKSKDSLIKIYLNEAFEHQSNQFLIILFLYSKARRVKKKILFTFKFCWQFFSGSFYVIFYLGKKKVFY